MTSHSLNLDPASWVIDRDGVKGYCWPVNRERVATAAADIVTGILDIVRMLRDNGTEDAEQVLLLASYLARESTCVFSAEYLAQELNLRGMTAELPENAVYWNLAIRGKIPDSSREIQILRIGAARPPTWRRLLRVAKDISSKQPFRNRPIEFADTARDVVCTTVCPLTVHRASQLNLRPVLTPLYEWFYPPVDAEKRSLQDSGISGAGIVFSLELLAAVFWRHGVILSDASRAWLSQWLATMSAWVRLYQDRLQKTPERLPKRLWAGSGGVIWTRLLAQAVLANGGDVTGHDHAEGANYNLHSLMPFTELQYCTRFVTFSEEHADLYRRVGPKLLSQNHMPGIVSADQPGSTAPRQQKRRHATGSSLRILYVNPLIPVDVLSPTPLYSAMPIFDWTARLVTTLQRMGHTVTQKPHPQSPIPLPSSLTDDLDAEALGGRFEAVMNDFDLILFDFPMQTSFGACLRSGQPMILIDLGFAKYDDNMRGKLTRRCPIVPAWIDDQNRIQVDSNELSAAIATARHLAGSSDAAEFTGRLTA